MWPTFEYMYEIYVCARRVFQHVVGQKWCEGLRYLVLSPSLPFQFSQTTLGRDPVECNILYLSKRTLQNSQSRDGFGEKKTPLVNLIGHVIFYD